MKRTKKVVSTFIVLCLLLTQVFAIGFADSSVIKRSEADAKYKWNLTDMYATTDAFYADADKLQNDLVPVLEGFAGKLGTPASFLAYMEADEQASRILYNVYVYAYLNLDLDQTSEVASDMASKADMVYGDYLGATAYATPELLALSDDAFNALLNDTSLAKYNMFLQGLKLEKDHILSKEEEELLSLASDITGSAKDIFDKITVADIVWPTITDDEGNEYTLSSGTYYNILDTAARDLRKKASDARSEVYAKVNNTLAATYIAEIKKNIFLAKARKYPSALEAALSSTNVPKSIYDSLVKSVNENLTYLHDYYRVRKEALGLDELYSYDTSIPLVDDYTMNISYDEAVEIIAKGLAPLGEKYVADFRAGINNNWVDVYEDDNKYTGGYQWGSYDSHPYILMNYDNSLDSLLTLAHEMGHALNSDYSNKAQDYITADYSIFTAEVASTTNEMLVMDYLIKNAKTDEEKLYLLNKQIDNIRGTVYVQVMFAEFEQTAHEMLEAGEPLSTSTLNNLWLELIKKYYGESYTVTDNMKYGWSRIPHFYMNFYVYKYATSMSAAYSIVNQMNTTPETAIPKYLDFLAAGGSSAPVELLLNAGVDMNSEEPVQSILTYFGTLVKDMDELIKTMPKKQAETATNSYTVKAGDMLWKIAKQFGVTVKQITDANNMANANMLKVGQVLVIPQ